MSVSLSSGASPRAGAGRDLLLGGLAGAALGAAVGRALGLPAAFPLQALALYATVAVLILLRLPTGTRAPAGPGLGLANRITLGRLVLVLPVAILALHPGALDAAARWWVVGLSTGALALDGVDGWVARRTGCGTPFGARFDMETDAGLLLVLSVLVWQSGQAPAWVILVGAMRYLFVAAGWVLPALRGELFPSLRRKVVCVVQGVALLVALGPVVPAPPATAAVGIALALLTWSFAVDARWLLLRGGGAP